MNIIPFLLLTGSDPWGVPKGGQTAFAKHLLAVFGSQIAVASNCDDETTPLGKWIQRPYNETPVWFFNLGSIKRRSDVKPLIPSRITSYYNTRKFMTCIRNMEFSGVLIDSPEMLFVAVSYRWESICYSFAGVNNPVANSRYPWARALGGLFEKYHISILRRMNPDVMIAAADHEAIEEFHHRTGNVLDRSRFHQFPTRVDTDLFYPIAIEEARKSMGLPLDAKIFVTTGRLCWIKGWDFLLQALVHLRQQYPCSTLIFVGDGEDHAKVEAYAKKLGVQENIRITGFVPQSDVVLYMNAADVCLVGSHREGWSLAMCEMIACGKAVVSTDVSGAKDMIKDGLNGYVLSVRDPDEYATAIYKAMNLKEVASQSLNLAENYSVKRLAPALEALWDAVREH